ncbi:MAG: hypothetical protein WDN29_07405 [Methylovirgula sp.]
MDTATNPINLPTAHEAAPRHINFAIIPGLLLTATIAATGFALHRLPGAGTFSPMILAIVIGHCVS